MFKHWPEAQSREKCQCTHDQDHADQKDGEKWRGYWEGAQRWRDIFLLGQISSHREHWDHHEKPAKQHSHCPRGVVPRSVTIQSPERRAVIARLRRERVQNLAKPVRTRIRDAGGSKTVNGGNSCKP